MTLTLKEVQDLCYLYDQEYGQFPESELEGKAVYDFIVEQLESKAAQEGVPTSPEPPQES